MAAPHRLGLFGRSHHGPATMPTPSQGPSEGDTISAKSHSFSSSVKRFPFVKIARNLEPLSTGIFPDAPPPPSSQGRREPRRFVSVSARDPPASRDASSKSPRSWRPFGRDTGAPRSARSHSHTKASKEDSGFDPYLIPVQEPEAEPEPVQEAQSKFVMHTKPGDLVPVFKCVAKDDEGYSVFKFSSDAPRGRLTFIALFCAEGDWVLCEQGMSAAEEIWREYAALGGCQFIAISRNQTERELKAFRMGLGATFSIPMAPDPGCKIYDLFATGGVPRFYLLDHSYRILRQSCGGLSPAFIEHLQTQYLRAPSTTSRD